MLVRVPPTREKHPRGRGAATSNPPGAQVVGGTAGQILVFDVELFKALIRSYALCNAGRLECLLFSGELQAAHKVSKDVANQYNTMFDSMIPIQLAHKSPNLLENKKMPYDHLLRQELVGMHELVNHVREVQDAALSKPYLIKTLIDREIDGYEYIQAVANEKQIIVSADVTDQTNDVRQVEPMLEQTIENMDAAGVEDDIKAFIGDAGYFSEGNVDFLEQNDRVTDALLATGRLKHNEKIAAAPRGRPPKNQSTKQKI